MTPTTMKPTVMKITHYNDIQHNDIRHNRLNCVPQWNILYCSAKCRYAGCRGIGVDLVENFRQIIFRETKTINTRKTGQGAVTQRETA